MTPNEPEISITGFLIRNKERLAGVGAFAAIASYFSSLNSTVFAYLLSFGSLMALVFIWSEIDIKTSPEEKGSITITFFKASIRWTYWLVILYILLHYRLISWIALFLPVFLFLIWSVAKFIRKTPTLNECFNSDKRKHKIISGLIALILFLVFIPFSFFVATLTNYMLELVNFSVEKIESLPKQPNIFESDFLRWQQITSTSTKK
jgi:hypothetical protein